MQFSIVDVASVFVLSVNHYPREFNIPQKNKKNTYELGPAWQNIVGNHPIPWQKKIVFSYSDPGDTWNNKLNDSKPLYSRKKSFEFRLSCGLLDKTAMLRRLGVCLQAFSSFPSPFPLFHFLALFISRAVKTENPVPRFFCSETKRKRLLRRLANDPQSTLLLNWETKCERK